jgi:hypothetical protein
VTIIESYQVLVMCVFININFIGNSSTEETLSSSLTVLFLGISIMTPVTFATILLKNWKKLDTDVMKEKFGHLYENLNLKRGKLVILEPVTFLLRRALLAYIVIYPPKLVF